MIGLDFENRTAYFCEVTTHIMGLLIGNAPTTLKTIEKKYNRQPQYAEDDLSLFPKCHFMFWSPRVTDKRVIEGLQALVGLELVINSTYTDYVEQLRQQAKVLTNDTNNPFFRTLQILEHLYR